MSDSRIQELEVALARMICAHENTLEASEGMFPWKDPHCVYCTVGATPHEFDNGPCAYHNARKLLGQL